MPDPDTVLDNRYRIVRRIGQGGMGTVYLAVDQKFNNTVALKENTIEDDQFRKAFEREAVILNRLRHPALPKVIDHFTKEQTQFLVMEYIAGDDLGAILQSRLQEVEPGGRPEPFDVATVLKWADQLLDALDYLHTQQPPIIHRDIKPQNLKLGERGQIILLDFGLAKGQAMMSRLSTMKSLLGYTPSYAPIEQMQGKGTDPRSDIYSLGATLYHLLTGVTPVDALNRVVALAEGSPDSVVPAKEINQQVPAGVAKVLAQAMAIKQEQRFGSAAAMKNALDSAKESSSAPTRIVIQPAGSAESASNENQTLTQPDVKTRRTGGTIPYQAAAMESEARITSTGPRPAPAMEPAQQAQPVAPPARKSVRMRWAIAGAAILLVAAIATAYFLLWDGTEESQESLSKKSFTITAKDLELLFRKMPPQRQHEINSDPDSKKAFIDDLKEVFAEGMYLESEGFSKRPDVQARLSFVEEKELADEYGRRHPDANISGEQIAAYHQEHPNEFSELLRLLSKYRTTVNEDDDINEGTKNEYAKTKINAGRARDEKLDQNSAVSFLMMFARYDALSGLYFSDIYSGVTDQDINQYYHDHLEDFERLRLSVISIASSEEGGEERARQKAQSILARIRGSERFEKFDDNYEPEYTKIFIRKTNTPETAQALLALNPGDVSDVLKAHAGFKIYRLEERKPAIPLSHDDAEQILIKEAVLDEKLKDHKNKVKAQTNRLVAAGRLNVAEDFDSAPRSNP
jgi:serine/threonine protein kinase